MLSEDQMSAMDQASGLYTGAAGNSPGGGVPSSDGGTPPASTDNSNQSFGGVGDFLRGGSNILRGLGLNAIPDTASALYEAPGELGSILKNGGINLNEAKQTASNYGKNDPFANQDTVQAINSENPKDISSAVTSQTGDDMNSMQNAMLDTMGANDIVAPAFKLGTKLAGIGAKSIGKAAASGGQDLAAIAKIGASKGIGGRMLQKAISTANPENPTTWDDLSYAIRSEAEKQLGTRPDVTEAVNSIINEKTPAAVDALGTQTSTAAGLPGASGIPGATKSGVTMSQPDLLSWKNQLIKRYAKSYGKDNESVESQVGNIARSVLAKEIHSQVPASVGIDKGLSALHKVGTDLPKTARDMLFGLILSKVGAPEIARLFTAAPPGE